MNERTINPPGGGGSTGEGLSGPDLGSLFAFRGHLHPVLIVVLAVAVVSALVSLFLAWTALKAHNRLVHQINRERTGTAAALKALGVPGAEILGKVADGVLGSGSGEPVKCRGVRCRRCAGRGCDAKGKTLVKKQKAAKARRPLRY